MTKYAVTTIYQEQGGRATKALIGVFTNEEKAAAALENAFHKACDSMGVEELNGYSHFTESDSFHICDGEDETWYYDGEIEEVEEDVVYTDESPYLISEEEKKEDDKPAHENFVVVPSLADLISKIEQNIDNGEGPVEIAIRLNLGAFSRKTITFDKDAYGDGGPYKFEVFNYIDETTETFTEEDLFNDWKTLIGRAIGMGQLYYVLD